MGWKRTLLYQDIWDGDWDGDWMRFMIGVVGMPLALFCPVCFGSVLVCLVVAPPSSPFSPLFFLLFFSPLNFRL